MDPTDDPETTLHFITNDGHSWTYDQSDPPLIDASKFPDDGIRFVDLDVDVTEPLLRGILKLCDVCAASIRADTEPDCADQLKDLYPEYEESLAAYKIAHYLGVSQLCECLEQHIRDNVPKCPIKFLTVDGKPKQCSPAAAAMNEMVRGQMRFPTRNAEPAPITFEAAHNVTDDILDAILEFCEHHGLKAIVSPEQYDLITPKDTTQDQKKEIEERRLAFCTEEWNAEFVKRFETWDASRRAFLAANYLLNIPLRKVIAHYIANTLIRGKTPQQIRDMMGITDSGYTEEEEKEIIRNLEWRDE